MMKRPKLDSFQTFLSEHDPGRMEYSINRPFVSTVGCILMAAKPFSADPPIKFEWFFDPKYRPINSSANVRQFTNFFKLVEHRAPRIARCWKVNNA